MPPGFMTPASKRKFSVSENGLSFESVFKGEKLRAYSLEKDAHYVVCAEDFVEAVFRMLSMAKFEFSFKDINRFRELLHLQPVTPRVDGTCEFVDPDKYEEMNEIRARGHLEPLKMPVEERDCPEDSMEALSEAIKNHIRAIGPIGPENMQLPVQFKMDGTLEKDESLSLQFQVTGMAVKVPKPIFILNPAGNWEELESDDPLMTRIIRNEIREAENFISIGKPVPPKLLPGRYFALVRDFRSEVSEWREVTNGTQWQRSKG